MAAAQGLYAEGINVVATDTNWVDVATIAAASFTANAKYLIIANAFARMASSMEQCQLRLVHGATPTEFTDGLLSAELTADVQETNFGWAYVYTQPATTELVKIQAASTSTLDVTVELGQIFALKLDDVGSENTDYYQNEVTADYTTTASLTAQAAVTFTPNGTDTWLLIANAMYRPLAATTNIQMDLNDSVAGTLVTIDEEGEDTINDIRGRTLIAVVTPTNASHTFSARFSHETNACTVFSSRIIALKLNKFDQFAHSTAAAQEQPAASPTWTTTRTLAFTPNVTGDWFTLGYYTNDVGSLTDDVKTRLQINNGGGLTSDPAYSDTSPGADSWDATDKVPELIFKMRSLSSGAERTVNLDVSMVAGTALRVMERTLVAFSLELESAGQQFTKSLAGTLTTAGVLVKRTNKIVAGSLSLAGVIIKSSRKILSGILSTTGTLTALKTMYRSLSGTLSFTGSLSKRIGKMLSGVLTSSGTLSSARVILKALSGAITFSGALTRSTRKSLQGVITLTGALVKHTAKTFQGSISFQGIAVKRTNKTLSGTITFTGALDKIRLVLKALSGAITFSGTITKRTSKILTGALSFTGIVTAVGSLTKEIYPVINRATNTLRTYKASLTILGKNIRSLIVRDTIGDE